MAPYKNNRGNNRTGTIQKATGRGKDSNQSGGKLKMRSNGEDKVVKVSHDKLEGTHNLLQWCEASNVVLATKFNRMAGITVTHQKYEPEEPEEPPRGASLRQKTLL